MPLDENGIPVVETEQDSETEDSSTSQEQSTETPESDPSEEKKTGVEKRIGKLAAEKHYWKGRAEAAEAARSVPVAEEKPSGAPEYTDLDPNDFDSDAAYLRAVAKQERDRIRDEINQERNLRTQLENQNRLRSYAKKGRDEYDDFDSVALNPTVPVTQEMLDAAEGDNWHKIMYALGSDVAEAARIASLSPIQQAKEIGKIEVKLSQSKVKLTTTAPNPPTTLSGGGGSPAPKSETEMTRAELHAAWGKEREERIKARYG